MRTSFFHIQIVSCFLLLLGLTQMQLQAQKDNKDKLPQTRILFVFDASQSMSTFWESDVKINIARKIIIAMIDSLEKMDNIQMALRVYGHQSPVPPQDCDDTKLEVAFGPNNASRIRQKLYFVSPRGTTPLAHSLSLTPNDFPPCENCRNIIILITDGIEACGGDPCAVSDSLQRKGIFLKPFIIGIGIDENFRSTFNCIGQYFNAMREDQFGEALRIVITQALNATTAQINLLDEQGNPTETNVNMTFYDRYSGQVKHNYIHTINNKGNPDTIILDPLVTYRVRINTIPAVWIDSVHVTPGKHSIFAATTPQGYLQVKSDDMGSHRGIKFIIRRMGETATLNVQNVGDKERYLVGKYELEVFTLPRLTIKDVGIKQSHTTTIEIPRPGLANILMQSPGYGSLYVQQGSSLTWVCDFNPDNQQESLELLPGKYTAVFRALNAKQTLYSVSRTFEIKSGSSSTIEFY